MIQCFQTVTLLPRGTVKLSDISSQLDSLSLLLCNQILPPSTDLQILILILTLSVNLNMAQMDNLNFKIPKIYSNPLWQKRKSAFTNCKLHFHSRISSGTR